MLPDTGWGCPGAVSLAELLFNLNEMEVGSEGGA